MAQENEQYRPGEDPLFRALSLPKDQRMASVYQVFLEHGDMDFWDYLPPEYWDEFRDYLRDLRLAEEENANF